MTIGSVHRGVSEASSRALRVGVSGCGYWGSKHVRVLSGLTSVAEVAVVDPNPQIREATVSAFPAARAFPDLDSALPYVDAIIIAVPARSHADIALKALRHGVHVLVEKPLATTLADAQLLLSEAHRSNTVLMVGHIFRFNPAVQELRRRIDWAELGDIQYLQSARLNQGSCRSDVSVVWDLAPHDISISNHLLNSMPSRVTAWGASHGNADMEDFAFVRLDYERRGVTAYIQNSWLVPQKVRRLTVVGTKKVAVYDDIAEEKLQIFDRGVEQGACDLPPQERLMALRRGDVVSAHLPLEEPLALEDRHFVQSIINGTVPITDGCDGVRVVAVLEAIDRSMRTGRSVKLEYPVDCGEMPGDL